MRPSERAAALHAAAVPPLTLFALPKAFTGHTGIIQTNAITSWTFVTPRPRIILLGDEPGTGDLAQALGLEWIPAIARNDQGTPLVSDLFAAAMAAHDDPWLGYLNSDIILPPAFSDVLPLLAEALAQAGHERFFVTSQRGHLDVTEPLDFQNPGWQAELDRRAAGEMALDHKNAVDLFLFSRGLYDTVPPFAIGRTAWDNWLLWQAAEKADVVIDASPCLTLIHQSHDYGHTGTGWAGAWTSDEARRNVALAGGKLRSMDQACSHHLTWQGLMPGAPPDGTDRQALALARLESGLALGRRGDWRGARDLFCDALAQGGRFLYGDGALPDDGMAALRPYLGGRAADEALLGGLESGMNRPFAQGLRARVEAETPRPLFVWGAGSSGARLLRFLQREGFAVAGVIDSDPGKAGTTLEGVPVEAPGALARIGGQAPPFVVIASLYAGDIAATLEEMGMAAGTDFQ